MKGGAVAIASVPSGTLKVILSELRRHLEAFYVDRLVKMVLYGSQARGDARPSSDIDVLVILKGPVNDFQETRRTEVAVADLCLRFDAVINWAFMDEEQFLHGGGPLLRNIRIEGIEV